MIEEAEVYGDEDGWHIRLTGELVGDGTAKQQARSIGRILDGTIDVRIDPQLLDDALKDWREHQAEGDAVRRERASAGGGSWEEHRAHEDLHELAREQADTYRDIARGK